MGEGDGSVAALIEAVCAREADFPSLKEKVRVSDAELKMSEQLVKSYETDFSPEKFSDDYQDELRKLKGSDFEAVDVSSLMRNPDSAKATAQ